MQPSALSPQRQVLPKFSSLVAPYMPAEWAPHHATWLSWPQDGDEYISFAGILERVKPDFIRIIRALAKSEHVYVNVSAPEQEDEILAELKPKHRKRVHCQLIPTNEPWCRDHGPTFVLDAANPKAGPGAISWHYNAWGGKYPSFQHDTIAGERIASGAQVEWVQPPIVLEGGSLESNGAGTLMVSETSVLSKNRNPGLTRAEAEQILCEYLGASHIIWVNATLAGDDTDGHVDTTTRFVSHDTILTAVEKNPDDANYKPLRRNLRRLKKEARLADGSRPKIVTLPMPKPYHLEGERLPATYANFYVANRAVLVPWYDDPSDHEAAKIIGKFFPDRKVVKIDCRRIIWGLGGIHCLTQQQPA